MKKRFLTVVLAIVCALSLAVGLTACKKKAPAAKEGTIYQTGVESFWVGVGRAYMTFENTKENGQVFNVNVSSNSGKNYESWLSGEWTMANNTLTLKATWETGDNSTYLSDAKSGEAKSYTLSGGKYTIGVVLPSAGTVKFTLDPVANKVGDGEAVIPHTCGHVCETCGKCTDATCTDAVCADKCQGHSAVEKTLQLELKTNDLGGGSIKLYSDGSFDFTLTVTGKIFEGTWAASDATNPAAPLTLTVDKSTILGGGNVSPVGDTMTVNIDASGYPVIAYSCNVNYDTQGDYGVIPLAFSGSIGGQPAAHTCGHVCSTCGKCTDATCTDAACADKCAGHEPAAEKTVKFEVEAPVYAATMKATLKIYEDGSWEIFFNGDSWCQGTWSLNETTDALTIVRTSTSSGVTLVGAENETVVCRLTNGAYSISAMFPSKEDSVVFTVNVSGEAAHTCGHVCETCGKCTDATCTDAACADKCAGHEATVMSTLAAEADGKKAKIELLSDKSWELSVCYYDGGEYTKTASGRWALDAATYAITLTVTNDTADVLAEESYNVPVNYETQKYSVEIVCALPVVGNVTFAFVTEDSSSSEDATVEMTLSGSSTAGQKGQIELLSDNTWSFSIKYWDGGEFTFACGGSWALDAAYNIVLTPSNDPGEICAETSYTLTVDYVTYDYSISGFRVTIPQVGALTFNLSTADLSATHYTVTYNLNYTDAPAGGTAQTVSFDAGNNVVKEYVKEAPTAPTREGYKFAGWYTVANPVLSNGAASTEYLFGTKLSAYNSAPASIKNDVCEISEDTTLYARWVQVTEISDAAGLKAMANDLLGSYKLTADITLTGEWTPVGGYYASYEFYESNWWLYSFRGELDGNGHKIKGLNITTLSATADAVSEVEGSKSGTAALFGSAVNCNIHDLVIEDAVLDVTYTADTHAYLAVVAGFVQGTDALFENITVKNADIKLASTNVWYVGVAGLFGGHWGGNAINCNVLDSQITVTCTSNAATNKPYEAIYVGGLVGEGYAWVTGCKASADITLTINDTRTEAPDLTLYYGGATASSTYLDKVVYEGTVTLNYTKANGNASINVGGVSGYQRYGYIKNCSSKASIVTNGTFAQNQSVAVGGILGAFDCMYGLMGKAYFQIPDCRITNSLDMASYTHNGTASALETAGSIPMDAVTEATAQGFGVDLSAFRRADNSINFFGVFNSVKLRGTAAEADVDGTVTVAAESALHGEAVKETLGNGWKYTEGALPVPDGTVATPAAPTVKVTLNGSGEGAASWCSIELYSDNTWKLLMGGQELGSSGTYTEDWSTVMTTYTFTITLTVVTNAYNYLSENSYNVVGAFGADGTATCTATIHVGSDAQGMPINADVPFSCAYPLA